MLTAWRKKWTGKPVDNYKDFFADNEAGIIPRKIMLMQRNDSCKNRREQTRTKMEHLYWNCEHCYVGSNDTGESISRETHKQVCGDIQITHKM